MPKYDDEFTFMPPGPLGKEVADTMKHFESLSVEAVYIPKELMPSGQVSSAHAARLLDKAKRLQLFGPDRPSERERIEKRYAKIKQEIQCELVGKLTAVLKRRINEQSR